MVGAVVFDLDALVDISPLAEERRRARWDELRSRLDEARPYCARNGAIGPEGLTRVAHEEGAKVGVLSDLPGPIARELAERFGLSCNRLIDSSDGYPIGPEPEAIATMTERLGVEATETMVVGSSAAVFSASAVAGARSAGVSWAGSGREGWGGWQPDVRLEDADDVAVALELEAAMGPIGEVIADGGEPALHWGSVIAPSDGVFAAGRHFSRSDRRLAGHRLTALIASAKTSRMASSELGEILAAAAQAPGVPEADFVVSVPARPSAEFDRLEPARGAVAASLGARDAGEALVMVNECENYIDLDRDKRRLANHGRFSAARGFDGETVVLIDDVITSGAQARACRRELLAAGAGEVWVLVAAASQDPLQRRCPSCGEGVMRRVFGSRTGRPFYGCSRYACKHTERWDA
jgi:phosphoglycolate phosphatase-like HAD superfamily hydrolase/predicted phosphoribosyltransferase